MSKGQIELSHKNKKTGRYETSIYYTVGYRVTLFRKQYPDYTIETEELENNDQKIKFRAIIKNDQGRVISTGTSEQFRNDGFINKLNGMEHAETSAVGRALAFFHGDFMGTDFQIASAEDIKQVIEREERKKEDNFYAADKSKIDNWETEYIKLGFDENFKSKWLKIMHDTNVSDYKNSLKIKDINRDINHVFTKGKEWCLRLIYLFEGIDVNTSANTFAKKCEYLKKQGYEKSVSLMTVDELTHCAMQEEKFYQENSEV